MRTNRTLFVGIILILMAASFATGYGLRVVQAQDVNRWVTFYRVLSMLKEHYVEETDDTTLMHGAINGMLKALDDPYTRFMEPKMFKEMREEQEGHFDGVGMVVGLREEKLTVVSPITGSPADKAGIKSGDHIVSIDDKPTEGMDLESAVARIRGKAGTAVVLKVMREGWKEGRVYNIVRSVIELKSVDQRMLEGGKIGYMHLKVFNEKSLPDLEEAFTALEKQGARALVLDMRNNPGGLLNVAVDVTGRFMEKGPVVSIKERGRQRDAYVIKQYGERRVIEFVEDFGGKEKVGETRPVKSGYTELPLVVLINEGSASASEIVAGALQDGKRAVVVGTNSFGKGSVQSVYPLPDGSGLAITTARYQTPSGRDVSRNKIVPDIEVKLSEEDVKKENDAQLKKAVEWLEEHAGLPGKN